MRTKKAMKNASVGILTYILAFIPQFLIRRIFLDTLGEEILGLNSLFMNLISYLSIVEMGIGSAIIFSLYRPFAERDYVKIKGYLNYYEKFYKIVGTIILFLGLCLLPFIEIFVSNDLGFNIYQMQWFFILFLINTYISYLFTYKFCLLNVAQENYKVSIANTVAKIVIAILQYMSLMIFPRFDIYIAIQIIINLVQYILLSSYIDKKFKILKDITGVITDEERHSLIKNVRALFIHKIGSIFVLGTDNIVISTFINLSTVARYNNYNMIINAIQGLVNAIVGALTPSIGNLLVEKDKEEAYKVHQRLFLLNFWIASFVVIVLYNLSTQFVILWLGKGAIIDNFTLGVILFNFYFFIMRSTVESFKDGSGRYHEDRYASLFESAINLIFSIILVQKFGLVGVFIGTLISNLTVLFWVKPLITYKYVFNRSLLDYFKTYFKYCLISLIPFLITVTLTQNIKSHISFFMLILNGLINTLIINGIYLFIFRKDENFIYFKNLIFAMVKKKINYNK